MRLSVNYVKESNLMPNSESHGVKYFSKYVMTILPNMQSVNTNQMKSKVLIIIQISFARAKFLRFLFFGVMDIMMHKIKPIRGIENKNSSPQNVPTPTTLQEGSSAGGVADTVLWEAQGGAAWTGGA